ncbi:MAG: hypothetical protein JSR17_06805 [Proteobacteria bacterium]|nr:hypothetical protein [Pseudomonadota bacterium]
MIFPVKKNTKSACVVPTIFPTLQLHSTVCHGNELSAQFGLFHSRFAQLANLHEQASLLPSCLAIDIAHELKVMQEYNSLEITVPVVGLTDLLEKTNNNKRHFASPIALNGFCAKSNNEQPHYPFPEFVLITDLIGNQYELIVNQDGTIELPQEGTGLFSLITAITFIYSYHQIVEGQGLERIKNPMHEQKILLLPPQENIEGFDVRVTLSHINERHQRIVDTIRTIKVTYPNISKKQYQSNVIVQREAHEGYDKLNVTLSLTLLLPLTKHLPFTTSISLDPLKGVHYSLDSNLDKIKIPQASHGWLRHPTQHNVFTKHIGLSVKGLTSLIRYLYSEYDFTKDILKGDLFNLSQEKGYNNFLLMPEALGRFYDVIVHDLVNQKMLGSYFFDRVPKERLMALDITALQADFHDSIVLEQIAIELSEGRLDALQQLLMSAKDVAYPQIMETFGITATGLGGVLPQVAVDIESMTHEPPLARKVAKAKDLSHMLTPHIAWTPLLETTKEGENISLKVTEVNGEQFETSTQVQVQPFTVVEIDPSHIHTTR